MAQIQMRDELVEAIEEIIRLDPALYADIETFVNDACVERVRYARQNLPRRR